VKLDAGYKFDDKKPDSPTLKIQFAHFPFRLPSDHGNSLTTWHRRLDIHFLGDNGFWWCSDELYQI